MRHLSKVKKLDRSASQRKALLRSLTGSLIDEEKIVTTKAKGRALAPHVERLITRAKKKDLAAERYLLRFVPAIFAKKLISEIAPRYSMRNGGYTRLTKIGRRQHDKAELVVVELLK